MKNSRAVHGVLLLDKPLGFSSNHAVQKIKHLYRATKVGHTGTLDPLATGMLALCLGEATKFGQCLLNADKSYEAVLQLGATTTTGDREGEVLTTNEVPMLSLQQLHALAEQFTGLQQQIPPMYSALKVNGKALYQLARQGDVIERAARMITIHHLAIVPLNATQLQLTVHCTKGTYIRTLGEDIGAALGCGGHLAALKRTGIAHLPASAVVNFEHLAALSEEQLDALLLPIDSCVTELDRLVLDRQATKRLLWGQEVLLSVPASAGPRALYNEQGQFLGMGDWLESGRLMPQRLINANLLVRENEC